MKEFFNWKSILTGVVSSLVAAGILWLVSEKLLWCLSMPVWIWLFITVFLLFLIYAIRIVVKKYRVHDLISEFTEGRFGDGLVYTWKFKKSKNGRYSVYGYEATEIRRKTLLSGKNVEVYNFSGYEVSEETIKMVIQLVMISRIEKRIGDKLKPVLEYMNWSEESQILI